MKKEAKATKAKATKAKATEAKATEAKATEAKAKAKVEKVSEAQIRQNMVYGLIMENNELTAYDIRDLLDIDMTLVVGALSALYKKGCLIPTKIKGVFHYQVAVESDKAKAKTKNQSKEVTYA